MDNEKVFKVFDSLTEEERNKVLQDIIKSWSKDANDMTLGNNVRSILNNKYYR